MSVSMVISLGPHTLHDHSAGMHMHKLFLEQSWLLSRSKAWHPFGHALHLTCHCCQAEPVNPRTQITSAERTNMWTVCLTNQGVLGYLNRRVSPLGEPPPSQRPAHTECGAFI
jgi:hypothetical protein